MERILEKASTHLAGLTLVAAGATMLACLMALGGENWTWAGWLAALTVVLAAGFCAVDGFPRSRQAGQAPETVSRKPLEAAETSLGGDAGVWETLWTQETRRDSSIPPFGTRPYWAPGPNGSRMPLSMIAYQGRAERMQMATSPDLDSTTLNILAQDPDPLVRDAASGNPLKR